MGTYYLKYRLTICRRRVAFIPPQRPLDRGIPLAGLRMYRAWLGRVTERNVTSQVAFVGYRNAEIYIRDSQLTLSATRREVRAKAKSYIFYCFLAMTCSVLWYHLKHGG